MKPKRSLPSSLPAVFFFCGASATGVAALAEPAIANPAAPNPAADTFFRKERRVFSIYAF